MSDPFGYLEYLKGRLAALEAVPLTYDDRVIRAGLRAEIEYLRAAVNAAETECDRVLQESGGEDV